MSKGTPIEEVFLELNKDPEFRKADRAIKPRFEILKQVVIRRVDLKMTQSELAKKAGMHQSRISKVESADHDIRLSTLTSIAEALKCEVCIQLVPFEDGQFTTIDIAELSVESTDYLDTEAIPLTLIFG